MSDKIQLNIRLTRKQKQQIERNSKLNGYDTTTSYLIDSALNSINKGGNVSGKIVTLSLSPAIDYIINMNDINQLEKEKPNKFKSCNRAIIAAGKGIHESIIIDSLGAPTLALHYSGGFTGDLLETEISRQGIPHMRFHSQVETRINIKLNIGSGSDEVNYELSELPPYVDGNSREKIRQTIKGLAKTDILSIAGSYDQRNFKLINEICEIASFNGTQLVFDLSSKEIIELLKYKPYLIKPNIHELEHILDRTITTDEEVIDAMKELKKLGAINIAVSMGEKGSLLLAEDGNVYKAQVLQKINLVSPQGAGDSFVGAFLAKKDLPNIKEQFAWANAAGSATAESTALADSSHIKRMLENIKVEKLS